jgi:hypothetical protein
MRFCRVPFYYVKIGLGSMPNNFLQTVLQVNHFMLLTIILNVEDGVNKYLGERE